MLLAEDGKEDRALPRSWVGGLGITRDEAL